MSWNNGRLCYQDPERDPFASAELLQILYFTVSNAKRVLLSKVHSNYGLILWCSVYSRSIYMCQISGTRPNSRLTSGSILVGRKLWDVERSAKGSGNSWRIIICKSAGSWR